jgi:hypothetical protein
VAQLVVAPVCPSAAPGGGAGLGVFVGGSGWGVSVGGTSGVSDTGSGVFVGGTCGVGDGMGVFVTRGDGVGVTVAVNVGRRVDVGVDVGVLGPLTIRRPTEHPSIPSMTRLVTTITIMVECRFIISSILWFGRRIETDGMLSAR